MASRSPQVVEDDEEVKSKAIVKYSVPKPANFARLSCNTDLNLPPSNWLSSSNDPFGLQHVLQHPKGFSSFRMANLFPDCVGAVDIVSDAENIKNLLKIPYHKKGHISMMVHRVENTLLLDDFDIYRHLVRTDTDWEWLRHFFGEHVNRKTCHADRELFIKSRQREALRQKSLISKFLYHSLVEDGEAIVEVQPNKSSEVIADLPEPPDDSAAEQHQFNRNVVWTFEDIDMLIGTDMPIFGGGTHPCISLRLRDMSKPINVLTGIDYWLDNLMSNVPEVVMCYHLNGIVQKYELIKTEDLPRLDNSKFSPNLIRDVAQSILSFLKSNATKAGHTYWLFKGKDEEVVKLYDLSSLCSENFVENEQNPFTVPVAMLLYRVARNMKFSRDHKQPGTIRMLLKNCIKLLPEEKYPEIVTSSHYMLSDLFVPSETSPEKPNFSEDPPPEDPNYDDDQDFDDEAPSTTTLKLNSLNRHVFTNTYKPPPSIVGGAEERCLKAVHHVVGGLSCLRHFPNQVMEKEPPINMANPDEAIPMPAPEPTRKKSKKKPFKVKTKDGMDSNPTPKKTTTLLPTWQNNDTPQTSWKDQLKTLLYTKTVLVYTTLSEYYFSQAKYGSTLRCLGLLARAQLTLDKLAGGADSARHLFLLEKAGDCCMLMVQSWGKYDAFREQLNAYSEEDQRMMERLEEDEQSLGISIGYTDLKHVFLYDIRTIEQILLKGVQSYEEACKIQKNEAVLRRFGNGLNELASFYLNKAKNSDAMAEICRKAEPYLVKGLMVFEQVKDDANMALLYTNLGHLNRLLAYASKSEAEVRAELTPGERLYYNKALVNYKKALQVLGDRKHCPGIWDAVKWELSTALFNMGSIMHEFPAGNLSKSEAEKEVIETLLKALQYCDFDEDNPKFPLYQYRAAVIHFRIASLYHSHIWTSGDASNRRNYVQLAKINYEKASNLYFLAGDAVHYLISQMQRFALSEYLSETSSVSNTKIKHLQHCLEIVLEINEVLKQILDKKVEVDWEVQEDDSATEQSYKTCSSLLELCKQRLQHILKSLIKLCLVKPSANKDCPKLAEQYKVCYKLSLGLSEDSKKIEVVSELSQVLEGIRTKLEGENT